MDQDHVALSKLVTSDTEAGRSFVQIKAAADVALDERPNPIKTIVSEGHLNSDPDRIRTYQSLPDLDKIDALHWAFVVTGDSKYLSKLHEFLLAWGSTNVSQGNPINDTKLEPAFTAYGDMRDTFSPSERQTMDRWLFTTAHALIDGIVKRPECAKNNWQSHRLKIIGLVAFILDDAELKKFAVDRYKQQIEDNLLPNGSSIDFEDRDALHYHCYDLEPLLTLAIAADREGIDLYSYESPSGASLPKSVAFLVPFCDGTKTHAEFVHSKVDFDRKRAASGDANYKAGRLFDPKMGLHSIELAAYFRPDLTQLAAKLSRSGSSRFPTWQTVLNAVDRRPPKE